MPAGPSDTIKAGDASCPKSSVTSNSDGERASTSPSGPSICQ